MAGVDEAGRGPLAGPVFAAAVVLPRRVPRTLAELLDDSKKLTAGEREAAFVALVAARAAGRVEIGVGAASVAEISRINILQAAMLAMCRAGRAVADATRTRADRRRPLAGVALRGALRDRR